MQKFNSDYASSAGIRAVVFDFGGVLFDWNPPHLYQQLIPDAAEREHFLTNVCSPDWNIRQDGGRTLKDGTELLVVEHPQHEPMIRAFYDRWTEMLRGPLHDGVEFCALCTRRKCRCSASPTGRPRRFRMRWRTTIFCKFSATSWCREPRSASSRTT